MTLFCKSMLATGAAALLATTATPVIAAQPFKQTGASETGISLEQSYDGHRRRWRNHDRVDTGDVLTGIGILAGIAILVGAANDASKDARNNDQYEPRYEDRDVDQPLPDYGSNDGDNDLGSAVSTCTDAAERASNNSERVSEIRSVTRDGDAWRVEGELQSDGFTCAATNGRVDYIRLTERDI